MSQSEGDSPAESNAARARQAAQARLSLPGRRVAWLDLCLTAPLALPFFSEIFIAILHGLHRLFGLEGGVPGFAPIHWAFVNIVGVLAVMWALIRLRYPIREFALADAYGRITIAALLVFWIWQGATPMLTLFVITEIGGALYVVWPRKATT